MNFAINKAFKFHNIKQIMFIEDRTLLNIGYSRVCQKMLMEICRARGGDIDLYHLDPLTNHEQAVLKIYHEEQEKLEHIPSKRKREQQAIGNACERMGIGYDCLRYHLSLAREKLCYGYGSREEMITQAKKRGII